MPKRIPVTKRAVIQRLTRHLLHKKRQLLVAGRGEKKGSYYLVSEAGRVLKEGVDPAALARDLGLMEPWEEMSE